MSAKNGNEKWLERKVICKTSERVYWQDNVEDSKNYSFKVPCTVRQLVTSFQQNITAQLVFQKAKKT